MPIPKRWSKFNWKRLDDVPNVYGVYELADGHGFTIYFGSGHLRDRLKYWKRSENSCITQAAKFRCEEYKSRTRSRQRKRALLREFIKMNKKLPRCNTRLD